MNTLESNLNHLKGMGVEEYNAHKKELEMIKYRHLINRYETIKPKFFYPQTLKDIEQLKPVALYKHPDALLIRIFVSSFTYTKPVGRYHPFLVVDEMTGKYLGALSLASDMYTVGVRDKWIGWTPEQKPVGLRHIANASTLIPVQPFGHDYLGGKLLSVMALQPEVTQHWQDKLIAVTTTSLYGSFCQYKSIPWWKHMGHTQGKILIEPDDVVYQQLKQPLKSTKKLETNVKQKTIVNMLRDANLNPSDYQRLYERGAFIAPLYKEYREYLRQEPTALTPVDVSQAIDWWKTKAIKRNT